MKSILKTTSVLALAGAMALPVLADDTTSTDAKDQKDLKKVIEDQGINYVETAQKGITLSGYVDTSYTEQFGGRGTAFTSNQAYLHQFDVNNNNFNVNAVKIALEKALPDKNEWAAGFRIDTMYGQDAKILTASDPVLGSAGSSVYLEQALVKFRIPVGNGLDVYMGKFVTFLGYEVIESPANLNFSRGLLFTNAIPLTHTGIYVDYKFNDTFEAKFGIVDGWNQSASTPNTATGVGFPNGTDAKNDYPFGGKAITGQFTINAPGKNANLTQSFIYSPSGEPANFTAISGSSLVPSGTPDNRDNGPLVVYDVWGNWNPTFVKDSALTLGFNIDLGYNGASGLPVNSIYPGGGGTGFSFFHNEDSNTWWGAALYASYKLTKVVTLSSRGEYLHEDPAFNAKFGVAGVNNDDWSETLTASFSIWDNLLTRVEYRYDYLVEPNTAATGGPAVHTNQDEVSVEAVYSF
ncbi:MAG: outer membrane beta-barrel protein [Methylacidiphilales bacterium]|nr:outer membrane beta-barrel protein [Candidatus Methylacidiphilales bacterium]